MKKNMFQYSVGGVLSSYGNKQAMKGAKRFAEGGMMSEESCEAAGPGDRRRGKKSCKKKSKSWDTLSAMNRGAGTRRPRTPRVKASKSARKTNRRMGF